tara:strand:+ start:9728 stop:10438 length:711 start_codon:yes stop_codon:yes gene_type:complete
MMAVAKNPAFAKKAGIPQRVGADFMKADKGRKFAKGGDMAKKMPPFMGKETKAEEAKEKKVKAGSFALYKKGEKAEGVHGKSGMEKPTKYAKGGGCELKGKTKAFAMGGMPVGMARNAMPQSPMGDESMPRRGGLFRGIKERVAQRVAPQPMPQQRGGLSNMSPEAKSKIGDALAKMMGGVRSTGAKTMASRGGAGFNAPDLSGDDVYGAKKGGSVKTFAKGGGCEIKGKTKGRMI